MRPETTGHLCVKRFYELFALPKPLWAIQKIGPRNMVMKKKSVTHLLYAHRANTAPVAQA